MASAYAIVFFYAWLGLPFGGRGPWAVLRRMSGRADGACAVSARCRQSARRAHRLDRLPAHLQTRARFGLRNQTVPPVSLGRLTIGGAILTYERLM